jgi:2-dehydropantoate 2-reductase
MGSYQPSSMIDYLEGREVEVDAIWGQALARALAAGAHVPRLADLHRRILQRLEERDARR